MDSKSYENRKSNNSVRNCCHDVTVRFIWRNLSYMSILYPSFILILHLVGFIYHMLVLSMSNLFRNPEIGNYRSVFWARSELVLGRTKKNILDTRPWKFNQENLLIHYKNVFISTALRNSEPDSVNFFKYLTHFQEMMILTADRMTCSTRAVGTLLFMLWLCFLSLNFNRLYFSTIWWNTLWYPIT